MCGCCPDCHYVCESHRWLKSGYETRACVPGCDVRDAVVPQDRRDEIVDRHVAVLLEREENR